MRPRRKTMAVGELIIDRARGLQGVYTIQQTSSKLPANVLKIHVLMLDVISVSVGQSSH